MQQRPCSGCEPGPKWPAVPLPLPSQGLGSVPPTGCLLASEACRWVLGQTKSGLGGGEGLGLGMPSPLALGLIVI